MKLLMYFKNREDEQWYGPVEVKNQDDIDFLIEGHRDMHEKYMIKKSSEQGDEIIASGEIEPPLYTGRIRKRKKY